eukprot:g25413.t1
MEARAVACSSCRMWEVRVTAGIPSDFTCEKCTQLQLLKNRVRKPELELDELRIIREAEGVIERSYREVVTPKLQDEGSWVIVRRGKGDRQIVQGSFVAIPLNNRVRDVLDRVYRILKGEGQQPEVMVHIGTNDIIRKRVEDLGEWTGDELNLKVTMRCSG